MKCIAVGNKKGGVGKSTLVIHLGCELAQRGHSVVLFDTDEQATVSDWCSRGNLPVEWISFPVENSESAEQLIRRLKTVQADYVIVDLPPHTREAMQAVLMVCDILLVPVTASGADFVSTGKALALLQEARSLRIGAPKALLVPSRVDRRTSFGKEVYEALQGFDERVSPAIGQRSIFVDCFGIADWVGRVDPRSQAYTEIRELTNTVLEVLNGAQ